jgi:4-azaleucine resistance transporter AzlC
VRRDLRKDVPPLTSAATGGPTVPTLPEARRRLAIDGLGIVASAAGFGFVYGLSARTAGFSPVEAGAMSVIVFAGAAQFAAVGYVAGGFSWVGIVVLTAFLNARHVLYSAALAPHYAERPRAERAVMAHFLTDEAFALAMTHIRRLRRPDRWGYWFAAIVTTFIPWNLATLAGVLAGGAIPDPSRFGLDVVFPAAMGGLAIALIAGRREAVAAIVGAIIAVALSLAWDPAVGIIAGGLGGPLVGLAIPGPRMPEPYPEAPMPFGVEHPERLIDDPAR